MALGYQARAMLRGLAKLGGPSSLAGVDCGDVAIERNVAVERIAEPYAGFGSVRENISPVHHDVASIDATFNPKVGQILTHPDGTFLLDRLLDDNGVVRNFIIVAAA